MHSNVQISIYCIASQLDEDWIRIFAHAVFFLSSSSILEDYRLHNRNAREEKKSNNNHENIIQ